MVVVVDAVVDDVAEDAAEVVTAEVDVVVEGTELVAVDNTAAAIRIALNRFECTNTTSGPANVSERDAEERRMVRECVVLNVTAGERSEEVDAEEDRKSVDEVVVDIIGLKIEEESCCCAFIVSSQRKTVSRTGRREEI